MIWMDLHYYVSCEVLLLLLPLVLDNYKSYKNQREKEKNSSNRVIMKSDIYIYMYIYRLIHTEEPSSSYSSLSLVVSIHKNTSTHSTVCDRYLPRCAMHNSLSLVFTFLFLPHAEKARGGRGECKNLFSFEEEKSFRFIEVIRRKRLWRKWEEGNRGLHNNHAVIYVLRRVFALQKHTHESYA